jgi:hypothetical protein
MGVTDHIAINLCRTGGFRKSRSHKSMQDRGFRKSRSHKSMQDRGLQKITEARGP